MNRIVPVVLAAALAPALVAQDRITWTDGTTKTNVRVTGFTWRTVEWIERGASDSKPADAVADLQVEKVQDAYSRALNASNTDEAYSAWRRKAEELTSKDPFLAQFGYMHAARLLMDNGQWGEAFALLEKMVSDLPETGFYPELYRSKLDYYLAQGQQHAQDAATVAKQYHDTAVQKAWPDGFVQEATLYQLLARQASGELQGSQLITELQALLSATEGVYPGVATRARVHLASAYLQQKKIPEAREIFQDVLEQGIASPGLRAQARLGLGYADFQAGDPSNTEPYRSALLNFLRVYLETSPSQGDLRAEALYQAALSSEKWRGPDSNAMARRLRGYLHRDYPDSEWAKR